MIRVARSSASRNRDETTHPWIIQNIQAPIAVPTATATMMIARSVMVASPLCRQGPGHLAQVCHEGCQWEMERKRRRLRNRNSYTLTGGITPICPGELGRVELRSGA